ncbi:atexp4 [Pleodorina starrii]|nr:atexp4 [Pleodorina starrii]
MGDWGGSWQKGRATRYGGWDDGWNINEGSCGYGYLDQDHATGWDIAAMSDQNWDFEGSCGRCFEVRCDPTWISDNYGESFDRTGVCRDPDASVIVQITDSCPCWYPANQYSNKRWCCGDMYHFDMSTWAFEKLAEDRWGVIGIITRSVACDYEPEKRAPVPPEGECAPNTRISRPWGWVDRRPWP